MTFNEKGEFIRTDHSTSGTGKPDRIIGTCNRRGGISEDDWLTIAKGLGALVVLAGLIWVLVIFREWIPIVIGFWVVSSLRGLFR